MKALEVVDLSYLDRAPVRITTSVVINATPEQVFSAMQEADTWVEAIEPMTRLDWTSPKPFGVGTTRSVYLNMPVGPVQADEVFIAWEENKQMAFYFSHLNKKIFNAVIEDYKIKDLGNGSSELTWDFGYQGAGIFRLIFGLMKGHVKKDNLKALESMKAYIEKNN